MGANDQKAEFLKGTLDMLILKVVALEPIHGYGIAQRLQQIIVGALLGMTRQCKQHDHHGQHCHWHEIAGLGAM